MINFEASLSVRKRGNILAEKALFIFKAGCYFDTAFLHQKQRWKMTKNENWKQRQNENCNGSSFFPI